MSNAKVIIVAAAGAVGAIIGVFACLRDLSIEKHSIDGSADPAAYTATAINSSAIAAVTGIVVAGGSHASFTRSLSVAVSGLIVSNACFILADALEQQPNARPGVFAAVAAAATASAAAAVGISAAAATIADGILVAVGAPTSNWLSGSGTVRFGGLFAAISGVAAATACIAVAGAKVVIIHPMRRPSAVKFAAICGSVAGAAACTCVCGAAARVAAAAAAGAGVGSFACLLLVPESVVRGRGSAAHE